MPPIAPLAIIELLDPAGRIIYSTHAYIIIVERKGRLRLKLDREIDYHPTTDQQIKMMQIVWGNWISVRRFTPLLRLAPSDVFHVKWGADITRTSGEEEPSDVTISPINSPSGP